ncbi:hypothetical protein D0T50_02750 [Bacteroides sp. 214]|uniref:DUF5723 family protein n=1 Tax=Bacteroides sp. 214 TaxID=2302935 RepID=UPI0013D0E9C1|nr:DUF5723 family protein [Bacteroides sp. 214]NDW11807.1 hypothetical protein [Bacteroides sp. 214]
MRKILFLGILVSLFAPSIVQAQYLRSSYFMDSNTRMLLNPALQPKRGYINLPVIGSLAAEVSTNALGVQDVIDVFDSSDDFYNNDKFFNRLKEMNELNVSVNTDIISFGFYSGKGFWSFNVGVRADVDATIPKTMFDYLRATDADDFKWSGQSFDIRDEKLRLNAYSEVGVGYSRAINSRLTIGGKAKLLLGAGNLNLKINQVRLSGKEAGIDSEFQIISDAYMEASGKGLELEEENGYINDLDYKNFGIGGYGAGFDLGASYQVTECLNLSAAILDLGFIAWNKSCSQVAESNKNTTINKDNVGGFSDDVLDFELYGLQKKENKARTTSLLPTMVVGGEYGLMKNKIGLGLLSTTRFGQLKTYSELTFSANFRPNSSINATVSYSMLQGGETFGIAFKLGPVVLGTDYMYFGNNSKHVNAFIGLSVPLGKRKIANI